MSKKDQTVRRKLKTLVLLAVAIVAVVVGIAAVVFVSNEIKNDYKMMAQTSTVHLKDTLEYGQNGWRYDEASGKLYCGECEITVDLFLKINESDSTVFHTVFLDDTRVLTNIVDADGNYVLGTKADGAIYESVKSGRTFTKNSVTIINSKYTVCYMPIYDIEGKFFGMLFTGINQAAVNKAVSKIAISIFIGALIVMVVMIIISNRSLAQISDTLSTKLQKGYDELLDFSGGVREASSRTDMEVNEIGRAMNNLASEAMGQASSTQTAMASTEEFTASIDIVNGEIEESYQYIDKINTCVAASEESIGQLNAGIDSNTLIVENISADIERGVESTRKADSIVKTIDDLALQINLLALNASVEASHAGEFGKGFAVVAHEIKNLAINSAASAKETAEIIEEIVDTMNKTSESNTKLVAANKKQLENASDVSEKMDTLKTNISGIEEKLTNIREKADSLMIVKEDIVNIVSKLSTTSQQNAAISEEVLASSENVGHEVDDLMENVNKVTDICDELKAIVDFFG